MKLRFDVAVAAMKARVVHADVLPETLEITTDTRSLQPGQTFLALRGEHFDGHGFVAQAFEAGASAAIVEDARVIPRGRAGIIVADSLQAYLLAGGAARAQFHAPVIGITGSNGKTTTKEFLAHLLRAAFDDQVLASQANENNEIGVSKLMLQLESAYKIVVVEMGARYPGDIARLVHVAQPTYGILTNIGEAHLETFGSREELATTKWGLFSQNARAILNAKDDESRARASTLRQAPHWFAELESIDELKVDGECTAIVGGDRLMVRSEGHWHEHVLTTPIHGKHQCVDLAAALAAARVVGANLDLLVRACASLTLPSGRYERVSIPGCPVIIYDAYNANPSSMRASLDTFSSESGGRKIGILASMAELGTQALEMHEEIGAYAAARVDILLVGGEFAEALAHGAQNAGLSSENILPFASNNEAVAFLRNHARPTDSVLLKGSRRYKLEEIIERLRS